MARGQKGLQNGWEASESIIGNIFSQKNAGTFVSLTARKELLNIAFSILN